MKKLSLFALSAALLTLAACSDDNVAPNNGGEDDNTTVVSAGQSGYMSVNINLPTTSSSSRANDNYDDGTAEEYRVNNAMLILFVDASAETDPELVATVHSAYDLNLSWNVDAQNKNITEQGSQVVEVEKGASYVGALVVLNYSKRLSVNNNTHVLSTASGTELTGKTLGQLTSDGGVLSNGSGVSDFIDDNSGILMTNTVMVDTKGDSSNGGSGKAKILVDVSGQIYSSEADALSKPAVEVVVERAVAKVTVATTSSYTLGTSKTPVAITGWGLTNTNTLSYLIRDFGQVDKQEYNTNWFGLKNNSGNTSKNNPYRFAGTEEIAVDNSVQKNLESVSTSYYRTYWGYDPNYSEDATNQLQILTDEKLSNFPDALYCLENTFDVEHMIEKNTTCAVIAATIGQIDTNTGKADGFYTYGYDRETIYDEDGIKDKVASAAASSIGIQLALANALGVSDASSLLPEELESTLASMGVATDKTIQFVGNHTSSEATVTYDGTTGKFTTNTSTSQVSPGINLMSDQTQATKYDNCTVSSLYISFYQENASDPSYIAVSTADVSTVDENVLISYYENGVAYYYVKVSHFGDDLTPWCNSESPEPTVDNTAYYYYDDDTKVSVSVAEAAELQNNNTIVYYGNDVKVAKTIETSDIAYSYPAENRDANYLGRYGVLRNNWYEISVTKVSKIGDASNPSTRISTSDTPDDELNAYISCQVNVLSWAKRSQAAELK